MHYCSRKVLQQFEAEPEHSIAYKNACAFIKYQPEAQADQSLYCPLEEVCDL